MKMYEFRLRFYWSLFLMVQLITFNIPAFVQIMAWCRSGDKPLSEAMLSSICASLGHNELIAIAVVPHSMECHMTWLQLINIYDKYVTKVYGPDSIVVFDDNPTYSTPKDDVYMRSSGTAAIISAHVLEDHLIHVSKTSSCRRKKI